MHLLKHKIKKIKKSDRKKAFIIIMINSQKLKIIYANKSLYI